MLLQGLRMQAQAGHSWPLARTLLAYRYRTKTVPGRAVIAELVTHRVVTARARRALIGVLSSALLACDSATGPDGTLTIEVDGRLERSAVVTLRALLEGQALPDSQVIWSAEPSSAVSFQPSQQAVLLEVGPVTISAAAGAENGAITVDVAVPPTIVFDLLKNGNRDIYRAALDGRDTVRLTSDLGDDSDPTVAGDVVVFVSFRDGNGELYMTSLEGQTPTRLTSTGVAEASPALSHDAALLAYTSSETGVPKLWIGASDGSNAARVTTDFGFAGSIETSPCWEPNGERVVFVSTSEGTADIFTHAVSTGGFSLLVPDSAYHAEVEPAWNPDGSRVAFATDRTGDTEIHLFQVTSGALTQLTDRPGPDGQPTWVGDGRLVYVAWIEGTPHLRWLDPESPDEVHDIDIGPGEPGHPSGTWDPANP